MVSLGHGMEAKAIMGSQDQKPSLVPTVHALVPGNLCCVTPIREDPGPAGPWGKVLKPHRAICQQQLGCAEFILQTNLGGAQCPLQRAMGAQPPIPLQQGHLFQEGPATAQTQRHHPESDVS